MTNWFRNSPFWTLCYQKWAIMQGSSSIWLYFAERVSGVPPESQVIRLHVNHPYCSHILAPTQIKGHMRIFLYSQWRRNELEPGSQVRWHNRRIDCRLLPHWDPHQVALRNSGNGPQGHVSGAFISHFAITFFSFFGYVGSLLYPSGISSCSPQV